MWTKKIITGKMKNGSILVKPVTLDAPKEMLQIVTDWLWSTVTCAWRSRCSRLWSRRSDLTRTSWCCGRGSCRRRVAARTSWCGRCTGGWRGSRAAGRHRARRTLGSRQHAWRYRDRSGSLRHQPSPAQPRSRSSPIHQLVFTFFNI